MQSREVQFIDTILGDVDKGITGVTGLVSDISSVAASYSSALRDYLQAKRKYVDFLDKYQSGGPEEAIMTSIPGLQGGGLSSFTNDEMTGDSDEMKEIGELVVELNEQLDILESNLVEYLRKLVAESKNLTSLKNRSSQYLDQLINNIGGVYDVGHLSIDLDGGIT